LNQASNNLKDGYVNPKDRKTTNFAFGIVFIITSLMMLLASVIGIISARGLLVAGFDISSQSSEQGFPGSVFKDLYLSSRAMYLSLVTGLLYTLAYLHFMKKNA
jgi:hypothetical protein